MKIKHSLMTQLFLLIGFSSLSTLSQAGEQKYLQWLQPSSREPMVQITFPDAKTCQQALAAFADKPDVVKDSWDCTEESIVGQETTGFKLEWSGKATHVASGTSVTIQAFHENGCKALFVDDSEETIKALNELVAEGPDKKKTTGGGVLWPYAFPASQIKNVLLKATSECSK